jgi:hypothetical protein
VAALLRQVADTVEKLRPAKVHDVTFGTEMTEDGPRHHLTVYFHPSEPD